MKTPVHVFAIWKVKEGQTDAVLHTLKTVVEKTRKEKGNLFFNIHQSNTDANTIVLYEGYTDNNAIAEHRNTTHYQELVAGKIIPLLESREVMLTSPVDA